MLSMKLSRELRKTDSPSAPGAAPPLTELASAGEDDRAGFFLVAFMRVLAAIWLIQGLLQWSAILLPPEPLFYTATPTHGAAVIFFAVLDPVAAAGLWLATPWGGALWLLGAIAQISVALVLPHFFSVLRIGADIALIAIYFVLTWRASRAGAQQFSTRRH
jgi:hypothetical protein